MKLVYAIVRTDNEDDVIAELAKNRFGITKLSTTGGFLKKGNTTLLIGTEDDQVDQVIDILFLCTVFCGKSIPDRAKQKLVYLFFTVTSFGRSSQPINIFCIDFLKHLYCAV